MLFELPFKSQMTDADLARLARLLDLSTHMYKVAGRPVGEVLSRRFARLRRRFVGLA